VKETRYEEASRAAGILGTGIEFLDWGDLSFEYSSGRVKLLAGEIRAFRPDVVLTHHGPDPVSVDHEMTWRLTLRAVQVTGVPGLESDLALVRRPEVFLFEATVPLTEMEGFCPDLYVDIADVWAIKMEALESFHRAQGFLVSSYTDVARRRALQAQRLSSRAAIQYAEAFERVFPWVGDNLPL
jgi:4-oxalomesaconate hydratase